MNDELRITEIFLSLQGESNSVGCPTVFVRLTGCPLRCVYCDSEYAFYGGDKKTFENIVREVLAFNVKYVCITGGEPLAQPGVKSLMTQLCDQDLNVSLETSGALSIDLVDPRVSVVMDIKTPDSGEMDKQLWSNLSLLQQKDQIKFVIASRDDYLWSVFKLHELNLVQRVSSVLFSPVYDRLPPTELANWILQDKLSVRFQIQLHKLLWGDRPGV